MSYDALTVCMTCKRSAVELDDGFFTGIPSLVPDVVQFEGGRQNFGLFHRVLQGVGFIPHELHMYVEFLSRHQGHDVDVWDGNALGEKYPDIQLAEDPEDEAWDDLPEDWCYVPRPMA